MSQVVYGCANDRFGGCGSILSIHWDGCGGCGGYAFMPQALICCLSIILAALRKSGLGIALATLFAY